VDEGRRHGRVDHRQVRAVEAQFPRLVEQALAVEGDGRGGVVGAREGVDWPAPAVVPDLRAVERQDEGDAPAQGPGCRDFDDEAVAVEGQHVRAGGHLVERGGERAAAVDRVDAKQPSQPRRRPPPRADDRPRQHDARRLRYLTYPTYPTYL